MVIVSLDAGQVPFTMLHTNVLTPMLRPDTDEVAEFTLATVPEPPMRVQVPVPTPAMLAAKVEELEQICWFTPALAVVGIVSMRI